MIIPATEGRLFRGPPLILNYHNGPLLSGEEPIKVYLTFYGQFSRYEKATIRAFLASMAPAAAPGPRKAGREKKGAEAPVPTVARWWALTRGYTDMFGAAVAQKLELAKERSDEACAKGKSLTKADIYDLVVEGVRDGAFPTDPRAIYLVLTAADVTVEGFCSERCGQHSFTFPTPATGDHMLPFAWVGNAASQCPGFCAWPFAQSAMLGKTPGPVLKAPNGVGVDGMVITLAKLLAGAATNPFGSGYYQGDQSVALEAAGACTGAFGAGAYAGNPGRVLVDAMTGASYNVKGFKRWKFLVPYMWNPATLACEGKS
ncbi:hypothetical protein MPTK1_2g07700 [Marchantia polymorpha subsp. ruderalis]|nr:hypothetical protein MARPO_0015s0056 [Marchantia polymorpha]BBN01481.1 hypothetical protein Mp_2g07700 [Marchantia polymorpha subsp. ruderalis]|eukprot:PTQ45248.1 hypothetical protein MARPO_0015s0056 [Marchantia polymorpha]